MFSIFTPSGAGTAEHRRPSLARSGLPVSADSIVVRLVRIE